MKITKDGEIEPCCEESRELFWHFQVEGNIIVITDIDSRYVFSGSPSMNFCPFCGTKTVSEEAF